MKAANFLLLCLMAFIVILTVSCSPHCDDEDYAKEKQEKIVYIDTLSNMFVEENNGI